MKHSSINPFRKLTMLLQEAIDLLNVTSNQEKKILVEITTKISDLQASIDKLSSELSNTTLTDAQAAAVQSVVDGANALDAIVPDAPKV